MSVEDETHDPADREPGDGPAVDEGGRVEPVARETTSRGDSGGTERADRDRSDRADRADRSDRADRADRTGRSTGRVIAERSRRPTAERSERAERSSRLAAVEAAAAEAEAAAAEAADRLAADRLAATTGDPAALTAAPPIADVRPPRSDFDDLATPIPGDQDGVPRLEDHADLSIPVVSFDPEQLADVTAEIRAVAGKRAEDHHHGEIAELVPVVTQPARAATTTVVDPLSVDELRDAWAILDLVERSDGLFILPREDAEDFFIGLPAIDQAKLLLHWRRGHRRQWLRLLEPDDVADVIQAAPEDEHTGLLALLDEPTRKEVQALLAYEEDEAGGLMNTRYARLRPHMTADEAISYLRRQAHGDLETIYVAYVLDPRQHLLGVVSFRDLFTAPPRRLVADIMETDVVRANDGMDQESLSRIFAEHDLSVIPVVDDDGVMKGIVTVDDIVDVVQEEATEDIQKFGGMEALELPYLQSGLKEMVKKRGVWLTVLAFGQMLTATALGYFQDQLDKAVVLTLFIPLVISSGGNSGSQASTLVIRAMALGEIRPADWWRVVRREVWTGLALGLLLGVIGVLRVILWPTASSSYGPHFVLLGITVGISLVGVVIFGTLLGATLPFFLRKIGADPASASAPFVATLSDVTGLIIYFSLANLILSGSIL